MIYLLVAVVVGGAAWGVPCMLVASNRNRQGGGWFVAGLLFGPFALIYLLTLPVENCAPIGPTRDPLRAWMAATHPVRGANVTETKLWIDDSA